MRMKSITLMFATMALSANMAQAKISYSIVGIGTLPGADGSAGMAINASGDVAGIVSYPNPSGCCAYWAGFLYQNGVVSNIGGNVSAYGINDADEITGAASFWAGQNFGFVRHAFIYSQGAITDLGTLGGPTSIGQGINNSGQVVGGSLIGHNGEGGHAFITVAGTMTDLGTLGGINSWGYAINASGQTTGWGALPGNHANHAFLASGGIMTDLGTLGGSSSTGLAINASGQVAGYSDVLGDGSIHAFLSSEGTMFDLGTLGGRESAAYGVNASGQVVGYSIVAGGNRIAHAFLFDGKTMMDLNDAIDPSLGWTLSDAIAINDAGQIIGSGYGNGFGGTFLLTPLSTVPEPKSWSLMVAGFGLIGAAMRRRVGALGGSEVATSGPLRACKAR